MSSIIVIAGGGHKVRYLIDYIKNDFEVYVVELNTDTAKKIPQKSNIHTIIGDATSGYILKKAKIEEADYLIAFTNDEEVNYEISKLGVEYNVPRIVSYLPSHKHMEKFESLGVHTVGGPKDVASFVYNKIAHAKKAIGIGLGIGEIVEVTIDDYSPIANKTLNQIALHAIRIGAIYRENELIIPTKHTIIKPNDKLLLIGDPEKLKYATNIITSSELKFPMQYGNRLLAICEKEKNKALKEALYIKNNSPAQYLKVLSETDIPKEYGITQIKIIKSRLDIFADIEEETYGIKVIEKEELAIFHKIGIKQCFLHSLMFKDSSFPTLVAAGTHPYKNILLYIFEEDEELIRKSIITAVSMQNTFKADIDIIVCSYESKKEEDSIYNKVEKIAKRMAVLHKKKYSISHVFANPVKEFEKQKSKYDMAIIAGHIEKSGLFKPNPAYYIANSKNISVLFIAK